MNVLNEYIFRVLKKTEFDEFERCGEFRGNKLDIESGYIHLSTASQVDGTINKYFNLERELIVLKFKSLNLGSFLKWEESRNSMFFPHYYGILRFSWIKDIEKKFNL